MPGAFTGRSARGWPWKWGTLMTASVNCYKPQKFDTNKNCVMWGRSYKHISVVIYNLSKIVLR